MNLSVCYLRLKMLMLKYIIKKNKYNLIVILLYVKLMKDLI